MRFADGSVQGTFYVPIKIEAKAFDAPFHEFAQQVGHTAEAAMQDLMIQIVSWANDERIKSKEHKTRSEEAPRG